MKKLIEYIYHFFPIQLLINYFKHNHILLFFWILLFAIINGFAGGKFGINALFLAPEYLYNINFIYAYITLYIYI